MALAAVAASSGDGAILRYHQILERQERLTASDGSGRFFVWGFATMADEITIYMDDDRAVQVQPSTQRDVNGFPNFLVVREKRNGQRFAVRYQRTVTHRTIIAEDGDGSI